MARFERYAPGQFSWVDLMTPDVEAATRFYGGLFGWRAEATRSDTGNDYTMLELDGVPVAGMGAMPEELKQAGVPPHWSCYVTVADADATAERARKLGAELQMPVVDIEVGGELVGRMTFVFDPEGARFGIWQPGSHPGSGLANVPGTLCWNELCSRDVGGAAKFYQELFGWEILAGDAENGYREIKVGDRLNGGILPWREEMGDLPPSWSAYFAVADCDAALARIAELGGTTLMGPADVEAGRFAVVADPQGAVFDVIDVKNPDDSPS